MASGRRTVRMGAPAVVLDVTVNAAFHVGLLFSLYLFFRGHNAPGGGFIAGLVAAGALVLRLITGRRTLQARWEVHNNLLLGVGMVLVTGTALVSLLLGNALLEHHVWEYDAVPVFGHVEWTSALFFDAGIYLVVVGAVATLLSIFGAEGEREELEAAEEMAT
jgi:multicomponent Na+:H+ antiporter subunit A